MLGYCGVPLGQCLIAAIQTQAQGEAPRATDRAAGDRMVGQGIGAVAVVVVPVHVVKQTPHLFAQGIIHDHKRLAAALAMGFGLVEPEVDAAAIAFILAPGGLREEAREVGLVGALKDAAGDIGHAFVGQDDQPGQIVLEMPKLALVVKQVAEDRRMVGDHRRWCNNRQFHHAPPCPCRPMRPGPRVAC